MHVMEFALLCICWPHEKMMLWLAGWSLRKETLMEPTWPEPVFWMQAWSSLTKIRRVLAADPQTWWKTMIALLSHQVWVGLSHSCVMTMGDRHTLCDLVCVTSFSGPQFLWLWHEEDDYWAISKVSSNSKILIQDLVVRGQESVPEGKPNTDTQRRLCKKGMGGAQACSTGADCPKHAGGGGLGWRADAQMLGPKILRKLCLFTLTCSLPSCKLPLLPPCCWNCLLNYNLSSPDPHFGPQPPRTRCLFPTLCPGFCAYL